MQSNFFHCFCVFWDYLNSKQKAKQFTENLIASYNQKELKSSNQIFSLTLGYLNWALNNPVQEHPLVRSLYLYNTSQFHQ